MRCVGSKEQKTCTSGFADLRTKLLADGAVTVKLPLKPTLSLSLSHPEHPLHAAAKNPKLLQRMIAKVNAKATDTPLLSKRWINFAMLVCHTDKAEGVSDAQEKLVITQKLNSFTETLRLLQNQSATEEERQDAAIIVRTTPSEWEELIEALNTTFADNMGAWQDKVAKLKTDAENLAQLKAAEREIKMRKTRRIRYLLR
ncbi:TPA: hypothetical protein N0F65_006284 [Lagenidium giganteum]|uniref:Uncharacterized protein n=1 Tax=Lagenidium giganteum TaxID=4803 RepID=A0AAV2YGT1_9STRA|nr:TPA: hypothetical protein N0F65_006284 [Lagenidium giganteum]